MARGPCGPSGKYAPGEQALIDRYTLAHASVGALYGLVGLPWWGAAALAVAWEVVENPIKDQLPDIFPDSCHDTLENAAADAGSVMVGYLVGGALRKRI